MRPAPALKGWDDCLSDGRGRADIEGLATTRSGP
jgi:hypothetical protein